MLIETSLI